MSVTFIEDHDTDKDHPFPDEFGTGDQVSPGYAYILTHPGIPCASGRTSSTMARRSREKIAALIRIRKNEGAAPYERREHRGRGRREVRRDHRRQGGGETWAGPWDPGAGWAVALDGNDFAVWTRSTELV